MKIIPSFAAAALIVLIATGCKGRTTDNVEPTGDTIEVIPFGEENAPADSMNHDDEAVTLPDAIEVPE